MYYHSPISWIKLAADNKGITSLKFIDQPAEQTSVSEITMQHSLLAECVRQLDDYFTGKRQQFDLPLSINSGTSFQQNVWRCLSKIPYGEIWTYQQVAEAIQSPKACRAVGQANRANPLPILIPCHRVIGKNGQLTGYMGACPRGIQLKKTLLALEASIGRKIVN